MHNHPREAIELLSVDLLDKHRSQVESLRKLAKSLGLEFGWHYLLDLTWILDQLGELKGKRILDAGAGTGILQWYLAQAGATVVSVDRMDRANLPLRFRSLFRVSGVRSQDLTPYPQVLRENLQPQPRWGRRLGGQARDLVKGTVQRASRKRSLGQVFLYHQDLKNLEDIQDLSIDAVVAVSALEHNSPEDLSLVVAELMRILRPGGVLAASLNAAPDQDWWHTASSGWCYTETSLKRRFCLSPSLQTNYDHYPEILEGIRSSAELRENLAQFYFRSGNNGMPWGKWDPQYVPVGVLKTK